MPRGTDAKDLNDQKNRTAMRRIQILQLLPPFPRKVTLKYLLAQLEIKGHNIDLRTLQRDLPQLADDFQIVSDKGVPAQWGWVKDAENPFQTMALDWATAIVFRLSEQYLMDVLPKSSIKHLKPYFEAASKTLARDSKSRNWVSRIRVLDRGLPRIPPPVFPRVETIISEAMLTNKKVRIRYTNTSGETKSYEIDVYGLVSRGGVIYLLGSYGKMDETRIFALHRIKEIETSGVDNFIPTGFSLEKAVEQGQFGFPLSNEKIKLHLKFSKMIGGHSFDVKISADQVVEQKGNDLHLYATVPDNMDLRWWILGFGDKAEVIEPKGLRKEIGETFSNAAKAYKS